ncbi:phosphotransferase [Paenibacillus terrigena]|uniref:phosphotransferase n=1 Tax=Paenibacillus terrigena TaxID=369333 RepID=UPI0003756C15|nr:phosphotransferase [Paenibacillus terrigena]
MERNFHLDLSDLQTYVGNVFGTNHRVTDMVRLHGGAQKVIYRLNCSNGFSCVLYVWDLTMNFFQEEIESNGADHRSYGSDLFAMNNRFFKEQGIRTPALYDLNQDQTKYPFDYALVEYMEGQKAEVYFHESDTRVQDALFHQIGDMLAGMHGNIRQTFGKVNDREEARENCHLLQKKDAENQLLYASQYIEPIKAHYSQLLDMLHVLASRIAPRNRYGFIHGELGPDHILVNQQLEPYLIDIEGAEFYDIELEHSFLELRFGEYYRYLKHDTLDPNRMAFYRFYYHISLTAGGLKLLHRGFPDQQFARDLAAYHSRCALGYLIK